MANVIQTVDVARAELGGARISQERRETIERQFRKLSSLAGVPVTIETVPNPEVDPDSYAGRYYWQGRDQAEARPYAPANTRVRAVHVETLSDYDKQAGRGPGSWFPGVELRLTTASGYQAIGDLTAREARTLALELLAAAELVEH